MSKMRVCVKISVQTSKKMSRRITEYFTNKLRNKSNTDSEEQEEESILDEPSDSDESVIKLPIRLRECRVALADIGHEIPEQIAEYSSNIKIEDERQYLIVLTPEKVIVPPRRGVGTSEIRQVQKRGLSERFGAKILKTEDESEESEQDLVKIEDGFDKSELNSRRSDLIAQKLGETSKTSKTGETSKRSKEFFRKIITKTANNSTTSKQ